MEGITVKVFGPPNNKHRNNHRFVTVTHEPSGLTVTKYSSSQLVAQNMATLELESLLKMWAIESNDKQ